MANEELTSGTIAGMAARLRQGEVSPVEVTAAHLARIERLNETLKAYLTVLPERAMAAAQPGRGGDTGRPVPGAIARCAGGGEGFVRHQGRTHDLRLDHHGGSTLPSSRRP